MRHIEIKFQTAGTEQNEILVALLDDLGFEGFEENENELSAFIKESGFNSQLLNETIAPLDLNYTTSFIEEENWNANWESGFEPITVFHPENKKPFAFVRAHFHPVNNEVIHELLITPKMSFGTGHHATTLQMIEQMSLIDFKDKTVIDFGTGTGLLAILAEKMGASKIEAIDNDDWSINNSKENISTNACNKIVLTKADTCTSSIGKADIILANINLNIIIDNLEKIIEVSKEGAVILFSGILVDDKEKICSTINDKGLNIDLVSQNNNWLVIKVFCK